MKHLFKLFAAIVMVVALSAFAAPTFAQSAPTCPAMNGELQVPVGQPHPDQSLAAQGYICVDQGDGTATFTLVEPPVVATFDLAPDVTEILVIVDGVSGTYPVSMVKHLFPVTGVVDGDTVVFEIDGVKYVIEIDQLVEVETAALAATEEAAPQTTVVPGAAQADGTENGICESKQVTFNETYDAQGNLGDAQRIDLSFGPNDPWHLDYYFQPGSEPFSLFGVGLEQRVVFLGYGSLFTWESNGDCADLDLLADVSAYRTIRGGDTSASFDVLNSGFGWEMGSFLAGTAPEVNVLNRRSVEIPPFRILEVGNKPVDQSAQPVFTFEAQTGKVSNCAVTRVADGQVNLRTSAEKTETNALDFFLATGDTRNVVAIVTGGDADGDGNPDLWYEIQTGNSEVPTAFVAAFVVEAIGNCGKNTSVTTPQVNVTVEPVGNSGGNCAASRNGNADGLTLAPVGQDYLVESWGAFVGPVVVPSGETVSGLNGALWVYPAGCAEDDAAAKKVTWYMVIGGQVVQQ